MSNVCPKCGSGISYNGPMEGYVNWQCGSETYHDEFTVRTKECLHRELTQANARIAELETDSNTDLINLVEILATRLGDDTLHDKLLAKFEEGHSTPAKCAADVIWDKCMEAINRIGEDVIKIAKLEARVAHSEEKCRRASNHCRSMAKQNKLLRKSAQESNLVAINATTRKMELEARVRELESDAHKLGIVEEFMKRIEEIGYDQDTFINAFCQALEEYRERAKK